MRGAKGQQEGPGVCELIKKPSHHVLHAVLDGLHGLSLVCVAWSVYERVGVCVHTAVFVSLRVSHHILILALDFVCSPALPLITVGYFVGLDVFWAAKTLCALGNYTGDPHFPLQVDL